MKLRQRILVVFAATVGIGMGILYFLSRTVLLSSFRHLENEQMKQDVGAAVRGLYEEYRGLGATTTDYSSWDRMYEFMADPAKEDISKEFQNGEMEGLGLNLIVIRDLQGKIVYAKEYDRRKHEETAAPREFLEQIFSREQMTSEAVASQPRDGLLEFPGGPYLVSTRPILTSQRTGPTRGVLLIAREFESLGGRQRTDLSRTAAMFERIDSPALPPDFQRAVPALRNKAGEIEVQPLSEKSIAGYAALPDIFGEPLMILRVDSQRPIYERGKLSQLYLFGAVFCEAVFSSLVIIILLQKFVLSRLSALSEEVSSIGKRNAIAERVQVRGGDELSSLARAINGMLDELEKSQTQFLFLTENIHQVFWIRNTKSGRYDYISSAYEKICGRPRSTLAENSESWSELLYPEDRAVVGRMLANQSQGRPAEAYYRIITKEGALRWLWERTFPVFDSAGQLKQTTGLTEDITNFKRNEEALVQGQLELEKRVVQRTAELAERGELVKLLVDSTPGAIYGIDAQSVCTFCNPAAARLFGYDDSTEILGKQIHFLIHHTKADGSPYLLEECPVLQSFRNGKDAQVLDELFWRKDGSSFPVEYSSRQIRRNGKVLGAVVSFIDITERKRQEMELRHGQKLEAVGRLAAGIAHEINTPIQFVGDNTRFLLDSFQDELKLIRKYEQLQLAAAQGSVDGTLLAEVTATRQEIDWPYLEEEIPRAIDQMLEGLGRVSTIVRGMKEFSHVDRSNEKSPGDINRALESTLIVARNEIKYVADVETSFGQVAPVICHLGDLNQVFLNLLINAAHAIGDAVKNTSTKGKIRVETRAEGDWVEISIADSGTGIPEEAREKIFDPFFTTKGVGKGTGQGLALARAIVVEKHGGTLTYVTEMGKGTTFFVRLPLHGAALREEAMVQ